MGGVYGSDFKGEVDVRSVVSSKEYFNKLVLLECFAEVLEGRRRGIPDEENTILCEFGVRFPSFKEL